MTEYQLQKAVVNYLDYNGVLFCGSMGGQYQAHISQRVKAKKSGYKRGFPDIFIYEPINEFKGLAIELKIGKNKASKHQLYWCTELLRRGYAAEICTGLEQTLHIINIYLAGRYENKANIF